MMLLLSSCVNQPVAADQRTTYWTSWTLLPLKASLSSLPAANRGWYNYLFTVPAHFNYIYLMSFHCSMCLSFHFQLKRLSGSSSCPCFFFLSLCLYFCLTDLWPVDHIRRQSCLKSLKSCRWVTAWLICSVCIQWCVSRGLFIIDAPIVHQGSRIDEQRCQFPLPLKVSLILKKLYIHVWLHVCWHWPFCEHHVICFPKQ